MELFIWRLGAAEWRFFFQQKLAKRKQDLQMTCGGFLNILYFQPGPGDDDPFDSYFWFRVG